MRTGIPKYLARRTGYDYAMAGGLGRRQFTESIPR